jgi:hypothetical protein
MIAETGTHGTIVSTKAMANAGILYDKYTVIQKLQKRGFSHEQAEVVGEVLTEADLSSLATKSDLKDLRHHLELALHRQSVTLIKWVAGTLIAHGVATAALTVALLQLLA